MKKEWGKDRNWEGGEVEREEVEGGGEGGGR